MKKAAFSGHFLSAWAKRRRRKSIFAATMLAGVAVIATLGGGLSAVAEVQIGTSVPLTNDFQGEQIHKGVETAVADLNAQGGVLKEQINLLVVDDNCEGPQALAAAQKFVAEKAIFVAGHLCSDASLAAAETYEKAGIIMISPGSTNPRLTEEGRANIFRVVGRDDQQGTIAAAKLFEHWRDKRIAILHDGTAYGGGLAKETKRELNRLGANEVLFEALTAGLSDYSDLVDKLVAEKVDVVYGGANYPEMALIIRQTRERNSNIQFIGADGIATEVFWEIAGSAGEGTLFTFAPDPRLIPQNKNIVERFRTSGFEPEGYTLFGYAAVQAWAQAAEKAGTLETSKVIAALRSNEFDTMLGKISFDEKGDMRQPAFVWYVWKDGKYVLTQPSTE